MDLVRDLLDKAVVDRHGREMGRVDSIVLEVRPGEAPRVAALELGAAVLASRVRPIFGRWTATVERALGLGDGRPLAIQAGAILHINHHVKVDLAVGETPAAAVEQRLRQLVSLIPGSS